MFAEGCKVDRLRTFTEGELTFSFSTTNDLLPLFVFFVAVTLSSWETSVLLSEGAFKFNLLKPVFFGVAILWTYFAVFPCIPDTAAIFVDFRWLVRLDDICLSLDPFLLTEGIAGKCVFNCQLLKAVRALQPPQTTFNSQEKKYSKANL